MTLADFLNYILSPPGAGVATWALLAFIIKLTPPLNARPEAKFWLAMAFAFAIPMLGYSGRIALGYDTLTVEGAFLAIGVGYLVSQGVHRGTEEARAARLGEKK